MAEKSPVAYVGELLVQNRARLEKAIPKHLSADRLLALAMSDLRTNPKLMQCSPRSLVKAVMQSAQLGLYPGSVLGHAYLVPYGNEATLIVGYRGFVELALRNPRMTQFKALVVREFDHFFFTEGTDCRLEHNYPLGEGERGDMIGAYAVWSIDGRHDFKVITRDDINAAKARSKALQYALANPGNKRAQDCPWITDEEAMWAKTAIRRAVPFIPTSPELITATEYDSRQDQQISTDGLFDEDAIDVSDIPGADNEASQTAAEKTRQKVTEIAARNRTDAPPTD